MAVHLEERHVVAKKNVSTERQARVEQMRAAHQATERRRTLLVAGAALAVVVVLVVLVTVVVLDYRKENPDQLALIGVAADAASCDDVITDEAPTGVGQHVGPGTDSPDVTTVEYETVPPSFGEHYAAPEFPAGAFYGPQDRPAMESLVHNLEHGYTVVWYAEDLAQEQVEQLEAISRIARDESPTAGKFIVSAWDTAYGDLPEGTQVALSHWGAEQGHRQLCGSVSGEVVESFITEFPASDSPEPNAP